MVHGWEFTTPPFFSRGGTPSLLGSADFSAFESFADASSFDKNLSLGVLTCKCLEKLTTGLSSDRSLLEFLW